ncbi:upper zone of growth plate and cartilage matrix associated a [Chanos chanos]|uniref:Unique cartilage matrix-associated protein n=1 Tax=Chanos chanos TaxID=29144 RepID=A0A6J2WLL4_CHACN|nr:unique cartilage matrix-associated protein [Chanos chanos]
MAWMRVLLLTLLPSVLILFVFPGTESAAVKDGDDTDVQGSFQRVFLPESDASNFFKRRGRRSVRHYAEMIAEQRQYLAQAERRREFYEDRRSKYENFVEEERNEQYERNREKTEQWREYNYDGLYPRYPHHRPAI